MTTLPLRTLRQQPPRQSRAVEAPLAVRRRLVRILRHYPNGLRADCLRDRLEAAGYTTKQTTGALADLCLCCGRGRHASWRLREDWRERLEETGPKRRRQPTIATLRAEMGLTREKPAPETPARPLVCERCGCAIGRRAEGELARCYRPACREAA